VQLSGRRRRDDSSGGQSTSESEADSDFEHTVWISLRRLLFVITPVLLLKLLHYLAQSHQCTSPAHWLMGNHLYGYSGCTVGQLTRPTQPFILLGSINE